MLDAIRTSCAAVADRARQVTILPERLPEYAASFPLEELPGETADPGRNRHGNDEATAAFVIALDAINFGSGYFPHINKRPGLSGYHTVAAGLTDYVEATGPITAARLRRLDEADCASIFGQSLDGGFQQELMEHFAAALNELGRMVAADFDGSFTALVESAMHSAESLALTLATLPHFADVHTYGDLEVPLYKRAQITPYDLAVAFAHTGLGRFDDLDRLTMFADNLVPHVLRIDGVLAFDPALVARIEAVEDIESGSAPEVEIRACALHCVEQLVELMKSRVPGLTAGQVDGALWARGGRAEYKAEPRHRTRCVFY
ncbi:MAG: hypothetical protein HKN26_17150 [Acidimicrobiales bacterium]|nr:hypothetical protein [Acidimicrobiales bacterium]